MYDLDHLWSADLSASSTGDLLPVSGTDLGQQHILRRLMTNSVQTLPDGTVTQADYIFHSDYGGGLGKWVGQTRDMNKLRAHIRRQILMESIVSQTPEPQIDLSEITDGVSCSIRYVDAKTKLPVVLSFDITR